MFCYCSSLTTIPLLDTSNVTNMSYMFGDCFSLKTFLAYGMKTSFNLSASTKFTESDLVTVFNNLGTPATTQTLTIGATNLAKLTAGDLLIATNKNWTVA